MPASPSNDKSIDALREHLDGQRIAMLTHIEPTFGEIRSQPMTLLDMDDRGVLWFLCEANPRYDAMDAVSLAFSDETHATYVSISGQACMHKDPERIKDLWTAMARPWFPEGPESDRIALLSVTPQRVEIWDAPDNRLHRGAALLTSVLLKEPKGLGHHDVFEFN